MVSHVDIRETHTQREREREKNEVLRGVTKQLSRTKSAMVPIPEGSETHSEGSQWTDYVRVCPSIPSLFLIIRPLLISFQIFFFVLSKPTMI